MNVYLLTTDLQGEPLEEAHVVRISPFQAHRLRMRGAILHFEGSATR